MSQPVQSNSYKIFITYRREDSQDTCGFLYYRLKERFGRDAVFKDVDSIPAGYSFPGYINHVLGQCRVVLVVMGPTWPTVTERDGPFAGQPRLSDPSDRVRIEVERALALSPVDATGRPTSGLLLIPLLVQGARMPSREQLPTSLHRLTERNATYIRRDPDFEHDTQRLISVITRWMDLDTSLVLPPPVPLNTAPPATPTNDLIMRLLAEVHTAFNSQDWPQVSRLASYLQRNAKAEEIPSEVYQMQGRALMAEQDYIGAKVAWDIACTRDPQDETALRAAAEARIAMDTPAELAAALPLLDDALTLSVDQDQRLTLLSISAYALTKLAQGETEAIAQVYWNDLLRRANEGLRLAGEGDANWLATKLEALQKLGRTQEALDVVRLLTARAGATASLWLTQARLAWRVAKETPTAEVRFALDAATQLAPSAPEAAAARQELLTILKRDHFPPSLAQLGFIANKRNGVAYIVPPLCQVPAGDFLMGSEKHQDAQSYEPEWPQHRLHLPAYAIGRFPVTVAEYACFLNSTDAGGTFHLMLDNWTNQLSHLDHPVVHVSWYEAVAYAGWLAKLTGQPWRLPTEAEWEKAARWDSRTQVAHLYPWGDWFDQRRCNTRYGGTSGTTAIGGYPNGASSYGAEEMAGNVWEWTHSLYESYPYNSKDGREAEDSTEDRVLRGGLWGYAIPNSPSEIARMAFRKNDRPFSFDQFTGFRLVLAATGS